MKFAVNNSPELSVGITKNLFNNKYLSDVQFYVDGKIIYAHSFELIKRSLVFQHQLESNVGDRKLIPIVNVKYQCFLQFIRFMYTDDCETTLANGFDLLKLAVTYKVVRLENKLIDFLFRDDLAVQLALLQFCIVENYQPPFNRIADIIAYKFNTVLNSPLLITIQPESLKQILLFNRIENGVKEFDIFKGLVRWIDHYCKKYDVKASKRRYHFKRFIRLIRFPVMSDQQILICVRENSDLFTDGDCASLFRQISNHKHNDRDYRNSLWNSKQRLPVHNPLEEKIFTCNRNEQVLFETKFVVKKDLFLTGLRCGNDRRIKRYVIKIAERNSQSDIENVLQFSVLMAVNWGSAIVNLGESLEMKPKKHYTIGIYYVVQSKQTVSVICRRANEKILVHDSSQSVEILEAGANMIEIFFKSINSLVG